MQCLDTGDKDSPGKVVVSLHVNLYCHQNYIYFFVETFIATKIQNTLDMISKLKVSTCVIRSYINARGACCC